VLSDDFVLTNLVQEIGMQEQWWQDTKSWKRLLGRFDPHRPRVATMLFESLGLPQELVTMEVWNTLPPADIRGQTKTIHNYIGWLKFIRFPSDAILRGLPEVLEQCDDPVVVAYQPGKQCAIRDQVAGRPGRIVTMVPGGCSESLFDEQRTFWAASREGRIDFTVPEPLRWDADTDALWQAELAGQPVAEALLGPDGFSLAFELGKNLASINRSGLDAPVVWDGKSERTFSRTNAKVLSMRIPKLTFSVEHLLLRLSELHTRHMNRKILPIHGSPHLPQWFHDGERYGLAGFNRLLVGAPELDIATLITDIESFRNGVSDGLNRGLIEGFAVGGGDLNMSLLNAYRAHKWLSKAVEAAISLRPDGDKQADLCLSRALACVSG